MERKFLVPGNIQAHLLYIPLSFRLLQEQGQHLQTLSLSLSITNFKNAACLFLFPTGTPGK
jgi:hypothetical protein